MCTISRRKSMNYDHDNFVMNTHFLKNSIKFLYTEMSWKHIFVQCGSSLLEVYKINKDVVIAILVSWYN